ncbi:hypothetical protein RQP46_010281 [Phenoliferia psychrophenolica]
MQSTLSFNTAINSLPSSSSSPATTMMLAPGVKRPAPTPAASASKLISLPIGPNGALQSVDLSKPFDASVQGTPEVLDALRHTILMLQAELQANKRAKVTPAPSAAPVASSSSSSVGPAAVKAAEKKNKMHLKTLFNSLKKGIKAEKWQGLDKVIKIDEILEVHEFAEIFGKSGGKLVQPTPQNKPTSTVTIMTFTESQIASLFGAEWKPETLKGHEWSRGGIFDGKSIKRGLVTVDPSYMEVSYSKGTLKASLKFGCSGGEYITGRRGGMWSHGFGDW